MTKQDVEEIKVSDLLDLEDITLTRAVDLSDCLTELQRSRLAEMRGQSIKDSVRAESKEWKIFTRDNESGETVSGKYWDPKTLRWVEDVPAAAEDKPQPLSLTIEFDVEKDGRFIAEILELPGCLVYGATKQEAKDNAMALAYDIIRECLGIHQLEFKETEASVEDTSELKTDPHFQTPSEQMWYDEMWYSKPTNRLPSNQLPCHPGEIFLREWILEKEMEFDSVAYRLGISSDLLFSFLREETCCDSLLAEKLSTFTNTSRELWLGLQKDYDAAVAKSKEEA